MSHEEKRESIEGSDIHRYTVKSMIMIFTAMIFLDLNQEELDYRSG